MIFEKIIDIINNKILTKEIFLLLIFGIILAIICNWYDFKFGLASKCQTKFKQKPYKG